MKFKSVMAIIGSNWVHYPGFYLMCMATPIFFRLGGIEHEYDWEILELTFISTFFLLFGYGFPIIISFTFSMVLLDFLSFTWSPRWITKKLIAQWAIISAPFLYFAFLYDYWLWIMLSVSFLLTQIIRRKKVNRIINRTEHSL